MSSSMPYKFVNGHLSDHNPAPIPECILLIELNNNIKVRAVISEEST